MDKGQFGKASDAHHGTGHVRGVGAICNCLHRRVEHANDRAAKNRILKNPSRTASVEKHTFGSDPEQEIATLKQQDGALLRSIGSISLVKSMIRVQLVDRLRLMIFPVVLGTAGREPILAGYEKTSLELISSRILDSRVALLEYTPSKQS